jgi:hypothetical protein
VYLGDIMKEVSRFEGHNHFMRVTAGSEAGELWGKGVVRRIRDGAGIQYSRRLYPYLPLALHS